MVEYVDLRERGGWEYAARRSDSSISTARQRKDIAAELEAREKTRYANTQEGDEAVLRVLVSRADHEQAFIEFMSMEGPFSVRVPQAELLRTSGLRQELES